jgi:hypothetical protein
MSQSEEKSRKNLKGARPTFIRILAVFTAIVAALAVAGIAAAVARFPFHKHPEYEFWFLAVMAANLVFVLLLALSVIPLWRARRSGLVLLLVTLSLELLYFIGTSIVHARSVETAIARTGRGITVFWAWTYDPSLAVQFLTLYPVIAPILIVFAWRETRRREAALPSV